MLTLGISDNIIYDKVMHLKYPIESGYINNDKVTRLSFIGSIPQRGMPFSVDTKLNNYEKSIVVTAYGYVDLY